MTEKTPEPLDMTTTDDRPKHMSHSSLETIRECGWRYNLKYNHRVPVRPMWASLGGSAVHTVTAALDYRDFDIDNGDPTEFDDAFTMEIARAEEKYADSHPKDTWYTSGKQGAKETEQWWRDNGPSFVRNWRTFMQSTGWTILYHDALGPMIEVELDFELFDTKVKVIVDRAMVADGLTGVVDIKSGRTAPKRSQLAVGTSGLELTLGIPATWGAFFDARKGGHPLALPVTDLYDRMTDEFSTGRQIRDRGLFLPNPSWSCRSCGVNRWCYAYDGADRVEELG